MFVTCNFEDAVRVLPEDLGGSTLEAVTTVIEANYIDHVVQDVGLVVSIFDILEVTGGDIYPSDGAAHFKVKFTLVIFRPLLEEVLDGKLTRCSPEGLWVSLDFFNDIFVPSYSLQQDSFYDGNEMLWFWDFDGAKMFMEIGEAVRLRVKDVKFQPVPTTAQLKQQGETVLGTSAQPFVPMEVIGAMDSDGLGCTSWWLPPAEEDAMEV